MIALVLSAPAWACGGFFCDGFSAPIDQAAERIVFGVDPTAGEVTAHVQITYVGEAHQFAWVLPVAAVPELSLSNDAIFTQLANASIPTYALQRDTTGVCEVSFVQENSLVFDDAGTIDGVSVVSEGTVGPYETAVLAADDATALVSWLQAHDYEVPDALDGALAPYVAAEQFFIALRLQSDKSTGDLAPIAMTYAGDAASIPIVLTSIAAQPGLPLQVYVLGPSRAVPDNYLHVQINEAAIDWWAGGNANYREVVGRAADEAGGRAFATDFSGPTSGFSIWSDASLDLAQLRGADALSWLDMVVRVVPASSQLTALMQRFVPPPEGVDATSFYQCPRCFDGELTGPFDAAVATDTLEAEILAPLRDGQALLDGATWLTRLSTSMDAEEMTEDPVFVFNDDLAQDVTNVHTATETTRCGLLAGREHGTRKLTLADGRSYDVPTRARLDRLGQTEIEWLAEYASPAALVIEDLGPTGEGTVLFDARPDLLDQGRGCDHGGGVAAIAALGGLALRRRRR